MPQTDRRGTVLRLDAHNNDQSEISDLVDEVHRLLDGKEEEPKLITVWRGDDEDTQPVKMTCKVFHPGKKTICGETMFVNTHFLSKQEAWQSIIRSTDAFVKLAGNRVKQAELELAKAQKEAAAAAKHYQSAMSQYEAYRGRLALQAVPIHSRTNNEEE